MTDRTYITGLTPDEEVTPDERAAEDELFENPDMGNDPSVPTDGELDQAQRDVAESDD